MSLDIDIVHYDKMSSNLAREYQTPTFHDAELVVNEVNYPVHKFILSCNSPYLKYCSFLYIFFIKNGILKFDRLNQLYKP